MKNITYAAEVPAGYEMIEDAPLHRYQKTWPSRRQERKINPAKSEPGVRPQTRRDDQE